MMKIRLVSWRDFAMMASLISQLSIMPFVVRWVSTKQKKNTTKHEIRLVLSISNQFSTLPKFLTRARPADNGNKLPTLLPNLKLDRDSLMFFLHMFCCVISFCFHFNFLACALMLIGRAQERLYISFSLLFLLRTEYKLFFIRYSSCARSHVVRAEFYVNLNTARECVQPKIAFWPHVERHFSLLRAASEMKVDWVG